MKYLIELTGKGLFFTNKNDMKQVGEITNAVFFNETEKEAIEKKVNDDDSLTVYPMYIGNDILVADIMDELDTAHGYSYGDSDDEFNEELDDIQCSYQELFEEIIGTSLTYGEVVTKIAERIKEDIEANE